MLFNAYEQTILILLNTVFVAFVVYNYGMYLKLNLVKNFYWGSLVFTLYVASTILNLQVHLFVINEISITMVSIVCVLTILSLIKFIKE